MLELGMSELLLVGIVALIIVGPKDLPKMFRVVGKYVGRAREMARDFQRSFEDAAKESGFDDIKRNFDSVKDFSPNNIAKNTINMNAKISEENPLEASAPGTSSKKHAVNQEVKEEGIARPKRKNSKNKKAV
ncbi:MAG: twin-arginine translocase subunit TatB [Rhodobacteraceae bacterium]|nr:MAG: twin-arginine translocase subunit TatB [Paracoccaceae bacterium]